MSTTETIYFKEYQYKIKTFSKRVSKKQFLD